MAGLISILLFFLITGQRVCIGYRPPRSERDFLFFPAYPSPEDVQDLDFSKAEPNDEQRLLRHILLAYDRSVRPVFRASDVPSIAVGMTLTHIFNIDEKKQVLAMNIWLEQEWTDERISWNPEEFGNITDLIVPTRFLWTPDIVLYNNAQDFSHGIKQTNVAVYPYGGILWAPPVKTHSTCKLDVSYFPFDDQICYLNFSSWIYDSTQMDVTNRSDRITIKPKSFTENGEWEIVETRVARYLRSYPNISFPGLTFTLHLRRRVLFYMYNIILPCVMLSVLTMGQFWLPCESGEKITLGLTVVLAYSVFSFNIAENMPETSEVVPLVAIYLMSIMAISALSVMLSVVVLNMRHGGECKRQVPPWLQYLSYEILGRLVSCYGEPTANAKAHSDVSFQQAFNSLSQEVRESISGGQHSFGKQLQQSPVPIRTPPLWQPMAAGTLERGEAVTAMRRDHDTDDADRGPMLELSILKPTSSSDEDDDNDEEEDEMNEQPLGNGGIGPAADRAAPLATEETLSTVDMLFTSSQLQSVTTPAAVSTRTTSTPACERRRVSFKPLIRGYLSSGSRAASLGGASTATGTTVGVVCSPARTGRSREERDDVIRRAGRLLDRIESEKLSDELLHEWRRVACIFDQCFFTLVLFLTAAVTVGLLGLAPRFSHRFMPRD